VEVATRDRSHVYRQGISEGAPGAVQVADRWHLLHNLSLVREDFLLQKQPALRKAATPEVPPEEEADAGSGSDADVSAPGSSKPRDYLTLLPTGRCFLQHLDPLP
jgi:hypothetical protein